MSGKVRITIYIHPSTWKKVQLCAKEDFRSASAQIEHYLLERMAGEVWLEQALKDEEK